MDVLGVDLSLTSTGLVLVTDGMIRWVNRVASSGTKSDDLVTRRKRLNAISWKVVQSFLEPPDLVVIEGPSMASKFGHAHDRSGLWWLVVDRLMDTAPVAIAPPSCRMKYATGKGNAPKDQVLTDVVRRYQEQAPRPISTNDEADALILAAMGARHLGMPLEASLPATHLKGIGGVEWPQKTMIAV